MLNVKRRNRKFCLLQSVNSNEKLYSLDEKARFARVCAARGWTMPYQDTCRDTMDHSYTLDPTPDAPKPELFNIRDFGMFIRQHQKEWGCFITV